MRTEQRLSPPSRWTPRLPGGARGGGLVLVAALFGCPAPSVAISGQREVTATKTPPVAAAASDASPVATAEAVERPTPEAEWRARAAGSTFSVPGRLIAMGDLHGDLRAAREALRLGGVIDANDRWIGGTTTVVQTGDQLDRGDDEPEILALLERLRVEAAAAGGAVHVLNGNHEFMNVAGDLRYVTPGGFADYVSYDDPSVRLGGGAPASARGRMLAFRPGADLAKGLAERKVIAVVGESIFVHGGVRAKWAEYGVDKINEEASAWLRGPGGPLPQALTAQDGPVWDRSFSLDTSKEACEELALVLARTGTKRMVVGHTVQSEGISSACGGRVWRIDVGMSAHYGGAPSVLEISGDQVQALR